MIVVKVELHSAQTGKVSEIGRMTISNEGTGTRDCVIYANGKRTLIHVIDGRWRA